ncbi:hypothetical protein Gohar_028194, partial [Gossypium harknessii]|nr:hypothetical protein [Gossypium harknessii]
MRTAGLGKTSEQWRQEIREEKIKANRWEKKFQKAQTRNEALEKSLLESRKEKVSLSKIEEMKRRVEEIEAALQNCETRIKLFEASEEHLAGSRSLADFSGVGRCIECKVQTGIRLGARVSFT